MHRAEPTRRRSQSPARLRGGLRGVEPVARVGAARDDAARSEPRARKAACGVRGRAVHAPRARRSAHAGRRPDPRQAARRAVGGARHDHADARVRRGELAARVLRRDPASARTARRRAPAAAPRPHGARGRGPVQHALAADRAGARAAGWPLRLRAGLADACGWAFQPRARVRGRPGRHGARDPPGAPAALAAAPFAVGRVREPAPPRRGRIRDARAARVAEARPQGRSRGVGVRRDPVRHARLRPGRPGSAEHGTHGEGAVRSQGAEARAADGADPHQADLARAPRCRSGACVPARRAPRGRPGRG